MRTCSCCTFLFSPCWRLCTIEGPVSLPILSTSLKGKVHKYTYTHTYTCVYMWYFWCTRSHLFWAEKHFLHRDFYGQPFLRLCWRLGDERSAWVPSKYLGAPAVTYSWALTCLCWALWPTWGCLKQPGSADHLVLGSCEASQQHPCYLKAARQC